MSLISVIVPVYNVEKYLTLCVNSILNQTFKDFEVILIDDGSTDNSGTLCDNFAKVDQRIKVIHKKNEKQGAARNCGVRIAKSDLISFVDSDDYISETYLEDLYKIFKKTSCNIVCCNYIKGRDTNAFNTAFDVCPFSQINIDDNEMSNLFKRGNYFWICWCKLIKKEILLRYPFPEGVYYEDNAVVSKWIYDSGKLAILDKKLYFYRINDSGTTKGVNKHHIDYSNALEAQIVFFSNKNYTKTTKLIFDEYLRFTTHIFFTKEKRTKAEAIYLKDRVRFMITNYGNLLKKDDIYGNRIIHPLISYIFRFKRKILRLFKKS